MSMTRLSDGTFGPRCPTIDKDDLYDLYVNQKLSMSGIGKRYDVGASSINRLLKRYHINKCPRYSKESRKKQSAGILTAWKNGRFKNRLCSKRGPRVKGPITTWHNRTVLTNADVLRNLYLEMSAQQIADQYGVSKKLVLYRLKYFDIPVRKGLVRENFRVQRCLAVLHQRPNGSEQRLLRLIADNDIPFKYVGDGSCMVGGKNPDFINQEKSIIVEVFGRFWHDPKNGMRVPWHRTELGTRTIYQRYGFRVIILWDDESDELWLQKLEGCN